MPAGLRCLLGAGPPVRFLVFVFPRSLAALRGPGLPLTERSIRLRLELHSQASPTTLAYAILVRKSCASIEYAAPEAMARALRGWIFRITNEVGLELYSW